MLLLAHGMDKTGPSEKEDTPQTTAASCSPHPNTRQDPPNIKPGAAASRCSSSSGCSNRKSRSKSQSARCLTTTPTTADTRARCSSDRSSSKCTAPDTHPIKTRSCLSGYLRSACVGARPSGARSLRTRGRWRRSRAPEGIVRRTSGRKRRGQSTGLENVRLPMPGGGCKAPRFHPWPTYLHHGEHVVENQGKQKARPQEELVSKGVLGFVVGLSHDLVSPHEPDDGHGAPDEDEFHDGVVPVSYAKGVSGVVGVSFPVSPSFLARASGRLWFRVPPRLVVVFHSRTYRDT